MDPNLFPKDFLWGAGTSSHQVEGGSESQWSEWELAQATELAKTAPKRLSWLPNWKTIKSQATDPANYVSGKALDHYQRYEEDFDLIEELHLNCFRFSIEWSRIEPKQGVWDQEAIRHYHRYINSLNKRGIEPILTIWHWSMPTWFTEIGGFENKANLALFEQFVSKIALEYAKDIRYVVTLNEPNLYTAYAYVAAIHPPQRKNLILAIKVYFNLIRAHRKAYAILKNTEPSIQVGLAMFMTNDQVKRGRNPISPLTSYIFSYLWNRWFLNRIKKQQDFIGVNHYLTNYFNGFGFQNPTTPLNDRGWYMEPEGILPLLVQTYAHYKKPIIITENGVADSRDRYRKWWLQSTLIALQRALSQGVELKGYVHWSLLDNFEWEEGWWPEFGLVAVDRDHGMKRTVRPSAKWLSSYLGKLERYQMVKAKAHEMRKEKKR
jgi:beta-glucosidase